MQEEEMLYQALRLKLWLERIQKDEWYVPKEDMKRIVADVGELVEQTKRGKKDSTQFFNLFFKTLDEIVLDGIYKVIYENCQLGDMLNSETKVAEITNQTLDIYKKRFGEIPQEEIDKELFDVDEKEDDLPF